MTSSSPSQPDTGPSDMAALEERFAAVKAGVAEAAIKAGRDPDSVFLVAVTKYAEPEQIRRLMELGHQDFGENRVQQLVQRASMAHEWISRHESLEAAAARRRETHDTADNASPVRWHMIGHVQRNKARKVAELCRLVHSVDSLRLAEDFQQALARGERKADVLIQVDCSGEESKFGCPVPAVMALAEQIDSMYNVNVRGLMTMAPHTENPEDARPVFARCRELFEELRRLGVGEGRFNLLSMGMTADYRVAIEEGSNIVRIGSAIFGDPPPREDDDED